MSEDRLYAAGATASYAEAAASLIRAAARASDAGFLVRDRDELHDAIGAACDAVTRAAGGEGDGGKSSWSRSDYREMLEVTSARCRELIWSHDRATASIDAEIQRLEGLCGELANTHGVGVDNSVECRLCSYRDRIEYLEVLRDTLNGEGEE